MSDADSLSEMSTISTRLMPKSPSIAEHHRILNANAAHAGNTIATFKAHKVRIDGIEERLEDIEDVKEAIWELKADTKSHTEQVSKTLSDQNRTLSNQDKLLADINLKLVNNSQSSEIKKMIVTGIISLLMAIVTAYCGYTWGHTPDTKYDAPTHQQAVEIDQKIKDFDPDNVKRVNRPQ